MTAAFPDKNAALWIFQAPPQAELANCPRLSNSIGIAAITEALKCLLSIK
jgi:hypothetical protein